MRPYGLGFGGKRDVDTEPRIKSARALVKREGEALVEEQLEVGDIEREVKATPVRCEEPFVTCCPEHVEEYDPTFICSVCGRRWGDFFYVAEGHMCIECAGLEFVP